MRPGRLLNLVIGMALLSPFSTVQSAGASSGAPGDMAFEVILRDDVPEGAAPSFTVVETDIDGLAGLFDEILAAGQGLTGERPGVTGRLIVRYRRITPIDTDLMFRSWVERDRGLRLDMRAECVIAATLDDDQPTRTADAEAFFVRRR